MLGNIAVGTGETGPFLSIEQVLDRPRRPRRDARRCSVSTTCWATARPRSAPRRSSRRAPDSVRGVPGGGGRAGRSVCALGRATVRARPRRPHHAADPAARRTLRARLVRRRLRPPVARRLLPARPLRAEPGGAGPRLLRRADPDRRLAAPGPAPGARPSASCRRWSVTHLRLQRLPDRHRLRARGGVAIALLLAAGSSRRSTSPPARPR